jgi:predicted NACHT family NTPase
VQTHLDELLLALSSRPDIRRLSRNPVMLTALAVVHWNEKRLPEQRADLYESIIGWLARARERRPGRPSPDRCVTLHQELALAMQDHPEGRQVQISRFEAAQAIGQEWQDVPENQRTKIAESFLIDDELDSGIVVARGKHVRFWHLTFQENLAARALASRSEEEQRSLLLGQAKLYRPEWREVALLLAGVLY